MGFFPLGAWVGSIHIRQGRGALSQVLRFKELTSITPQPCKLASCRVLSSLVMDLDTLAPTFGIC